MSSKYICDYDFIEMLEYGDITRKVIGCAMKVDSTLGHGFPEVIYHRALVKEFTGSGVEFLSEPEVTIHYNGDPIGKRRVDFLVARIIPVEIKAMASLERAHFSQALNYLKSYQLPFGLLLNFGASSLQFHRLTNKALQNDIPRISPKSQKSQS